MSKPTKNIIFGNLGDLIILDEREQDAIAPRFLVELQYDQKWETHFKATRDTR